MEPKVHYRIHKSPLPVHILNQNNSVHSPHHTSWRSILMLSQLPSIMSHFHCLCFAVLEAVPPSATWESTVRIRLTSIRYVVRHVKYNERTSVPFDDAVSSYDYTASVAYEDEYEAMVDSSSSASMRQWRTAAVLREKNQSQCHFVHHKSHMHWPEIEPGTYYTATAYVINYHVLGKMWSKSGVSILFWGARVRALLWADLGTARVKIRLSGA
jgi:hypothetical protein